MRKLAGLPMIVAVLISSLHGGCTGTKSKETKEPAVPIQSPATQEVADNRAIREVSPTEEPASAPPSALIEDAAITLQIGDPAPSLQIADWVKGSPVEVFEAGRVYVVEFWATWCGPCKTSMPHISKLQEEYTDTVMFVGVSHENRKTVDDFFASKGPGGKTWGEIVNYAIALDTDEQDTSNGYMRAAGQTGIPTAFVVGKDGRVEWIGHPDGIERPLRQIVDGLWDRDQFALQLARRQQQQGAVRKAFALIRQKEYEKGLDRLKTIVKDDWDNAGFLNGVAWTAATDIPAESTDLAWAEEVALRASELTDHKDASILDTVARVYYEQKNLSAAIEWQQKAVDLSDDASYADTLKLYQQQRDGVQADAMAETRDEDQADQ